MRGAIAILVAAGRGERMGTGRPKAFLPLAGRALLLRAADAFESVAEVGAVVAVVPSEEQRAARDLLAPIAKVTAIVAGGATRQESVRAGLDALPPQFDGIVLVHDAARPCLGKAELDRLIAEASEDEAGALLALPVSDTLKRASSEGRVVETQAREHLWRAQTPQMFRLDALRRAFAQQDALQCTDESQAVEALGLAPRLVRGSAANIKITFPEDLPLASAILASQEQGRDA